MAYSNQLLPEKIDDLLNVMDKMGRRNFLKMYSDDKKNKNIDYEESMVNPRVAFDRIVEYLINSNPKKNSKTYKAILSSIVPERHYDVNANFKEDSVLSDERIEDHIKHCAIKDYSHMAEGLSDLLEDIQSIRLNSKQNFFGVSVLCDLSAKDTGKYLSEKIGDLLNVMDKSKRKLFVKMYQNAKSNKNLPWRRSMVNPRVAFDVIIDYSIRTSPKKDSPMYNAVDKILSEKFKSRDINGEIITSSILNNERIEELIEDCISNDSKDIEEYLSGLLKSIEEIRHSDRELLIKLRDFDTSKVCNTSSLFQNADRPLKLPDFDESAVRGVFKITPDKIDESQKPKM